MKIASSLSKRNIVRYHEFNHTLVETSPTAAVNEHRYENASVDRFVIKFGGSLGEEC